MDRWTPTDWQAPMDRWTPTGLPPAEPPGPGGEHDGDPRPEPPDAEPQPPDVELQPPDVELQPPDVEKVTGRCHGGGQVEERELPAAGSVREWRPRPATPEELDDARTVLVVHRLDSQAGQCAACAADCPCTPALEAGRVLAEAGAWNTVPFAGPVGWRVGPGRTSAAGGRITRLAGPARHFGRLARRLGRLARCLGRLARHLPWTAAK